MAYIGKSPSTKFSAAAKVDTFTGDGSTTTFDLANIIPAGGENSLQVFVNNVRQKPGASNAFTVGNDGSGDLKRIHSQKHQLPLMKFMSSQLLKQQILLK